MKITEVGITVKREIDTGYRPYMAYLAELAAKRAQVPFGSRMQGRAEVSLWQKATIEEGDDVAALVPVMIARVDDAVLAQLRATFPECFDPDVPVLSVGEFGYRTVEVKLVEPKEGEF